MVLLHHLEECTLPLPNMQSGTDTCLEGTQLNMAVNSTATKIATLKLKKNRSEYVSFKIHFNVNYLYLALR